jgi:glycosyltransferase involved in cell wall biosynthesis
VRIALIAHGALPIPPTGWGAVENTLWHYKTHLERLGHVVDVYNDRRIDRVLQAINRCRYDFIECHSELFFAHCNVHLVEPYVATSHYGGWMEFTPGAGSSFDYLFRDALGAPGLIALSGPIARRYAAAGYQGFLRVLRNGVEADAFRVAPFGRPRAICVGRISERKRQAVLAGLVRGRVALDFVGPWDGRPADAAPTAALRYLGEWDKATLYARLTDYSCLVLLSQSEAAPKVVLEAMAAGLSVVIPGGVLEADAVCDAIQSAIDGNPRRRGDIVAYARERFDYGVVVREYLDLVDEFKSRTRVPYGASCSDSQRRSLQASTSSRSTSTATDL